MNVHVQIGNWLGDLIAALAIVGTALGYLPYVAAIAGLIWYLIQIKESKTVHAWFAQRRASRIARLRERLARLEKD